MDITAPAGGAPPHPAPPAAYTKCVDRIFDAEYDRNLHLRWHPLVASIEAHMAAVRHCRSHLRKGERCPSP